ncbi:MAG: PDZ domain-containing protein [Gammaproteobacteria bacterium]|nr:PDZ domain-containing protein [Gammaproteobacteria bacterium]
MQGLSTILLASISAMVVGIVLGANVFAKNDLSANDFIDDSDVRVENVFESTTIAADLSSTLDEVLIRLAETESRLQEHQQLLVQLSDKLSVLEPISLGGVSLEEELVKEPQTLSGVVGVEAFLDAGFSYDKAVELDERYADLELRGLYLRDQALREGWISEPRFAEERAKLSSEEEAISDELGEDTYERYLYATGQSNSVSVSSVIRKSPAESSGIEGGDVIYRYAGDRIYDSFDLRNATSEGEAGETVAVEVLRDEAIIELYVPRGPLGVQLESVSLKPEP